MRFEKAQDPANTVRALARAIALMKLVCPEARLVGRLTDVYESLPKPRTIRLNLGVLNRKLGREVSTEDARDILGRLAFGVDDREPGVFQVTVPSWRATKDVSEPDDLVEEVGRMIGYGSITPTAPLVACTVPPDNPERVWHRELRSMLAARGFTEVYNYSFLSDAQARRFQLPDDSVRVLNPIASDQNLLRSSLIPGIFANLELNAKHLQSFSLFEIGREIHARPGGLPLEVTHFAAASYAADGDGTSALFQLKRIAEAIAPGAQIEPAMETETRGYEHPARTGNVVLGGTVVGRLFEAHPRMLDGRAAVLDLDLGSILQQRAPMAKYTPIRRFPSSAFDLSMIAPRRELSGDLEARLRGFAGPLLESVVYLREYTGPQVPEDRKSVSYRFTLGARERTLSSEEVNSVRAGIIAKMRELGYEMRE
jgi:phenylalanyl-tRNA synthetase beta chain